VDEGPLAPFPDMSNVQNMHDITPKAKYDMTTFDDTLVKASNRPIPLDRCRTVERNLKSV
jgi:hypothetical protein